MSLDYSDFDAAAYLRLRFTFSEDQPKLVYMHDSLDFMRRFFQEYGDKHFDSTRTKAVEIGGGPSILHLISAAPYVSEIVFTDYVPACLEQVNLWRRKAPSAFNWGPAFEYVANQENPESLTLSEMAKKEEKVREKLTKLCLCDLTKEPVVDRVVIPKGGFDILITSGAIEVSAKSEADMVVMLQKCSNLLANGGFMVAIVHEMLSTYKAKGEDDKELHTFYITEDMLRRGLNEAGLSVERFLTSEGKSTVASKMGPVHRVVARKNNV